MPVAVSCLPNNNMTVTTPTLLIIFNRPDKVRELINALRPIKPSVLYVAADGPRETRETDKVLCQETRDLLSTIDWPCELHTLFQERNLGCKIGVSTAITWFFNNVESGIILEDDCIPTPEFFVYAADTLERYKDSNVMHINGSTFVPTNGEISYHGSHIPLVWGWASWRRAWQKYDITMTNLSTASRSFRQRNLFGKGSYRRFWVSLFTHVRDANIDTWDAQWVYSILIHGGSCLTPKCNLIKNIGFDASATHTTETVAFARGHEILPLPLVHPDSITPDGRLDAISMNTAFITTLKQKIRFFIQGIYS